MLAASGLGSSLFAVGVWLSNEGLESVVLEHLVHDEYQSIIKNHHADTSTTNYSTQLKVYVGNGSDELPAIIAALPPGDHHGVVIGERRYQVFVGEHDGERIHLLYDITEWENSESVMIAILVAGVLGVSAISVWLGLWSSGQILEPVTRLARTVMAVQPSDRNVQIARDFEGVEVAAIAKAFDRFLSRIDDFVVREQTFTAAASHELRTPLAVMQGASDVINENQGLSAAGLRANARIQRACREMREFLDALLFMSREQTESEMESTGCEVSQLVSELVDDYRGIYGEKVTRIDFFAKNPLTLDVPPSLPTIVISNLLRNAIEHTPRGTITVTLDQFELLVQDDGHGLKTDVEDDLFHRDYSTKENGGMGLHIVRRISDQCGWKVRVFNKHGGGVTASLLFAATETAQESPSDRPTKDTL